MPAQDLEAAIAAFIRTKGVTRCPTACVAPTYASGTLADQAALRRRAEQREIQREEGRLRAALRPMAA
jgi:hypothetical protein